MCNDSVGIEFEKGYTQTQRNLLILVGAVPLQLSHSVSLLLPDKDRNAPTKQSHKRIPVNKRDPDGSDGRYVLRAPVLAETNARSA